MRRPVLTVLNEKQEAGLSALPRRKQGRESNAGMVKRKG